jgi:hypothetical protein
MSFSETFIPVYESAEFTMSSTNSSLNSTTKIYINETLITSIVGSIPSKKFTTESTINLMELTTKTLSLSNKSLSTSIVTESIKTSLINSNKNMYDSNMNNSKTSNQRSSIKGVIIKHNNPINKIHQKSSKNETPIFGHLFNIHNIYRNYHYDR